MIRRGQRCVKLLVLLSGDGFLLCSYVAIIYPDLTVNKGKQCVHLRHQPLSYWHMVLDFKNSVFLKEAIEVKIKWRSLDCHPLKLSLVL